jgi:hypothetical protein
MLGRSAGVDLAGGARRRERAARESARESQCAARRASCRTSWFYPRWATMYPDTATTPSLTGRPPRIVNIYTQMIVPPVHDECRRSFLHWFFIYVKHEAAWVNPFSNPLGLPYLLVRPPLRDDAVSCVSLHTCTRTLRKILRGGSSKELKRKRKKGVLETRAANI